MKKQYFFVILILFIFCKHDIKKNEFKIIKGEFKNYNNFITIRNELLFLNLDFEYLIIFPYTSIMLEEKSIQLIDGGYLRVKKSFSLINKIKSDFYSFKEEKIFPEKVEQGGFAIHYFKLPISFSKIKNYEINSEVIFKLNNYNQEDEKKETLMPVKRNINEYFFIIPINIYLEVLNYILDIEIKNQDILFKYKKSYDVIKKERGYQEIRFKYNKAREIMSCNRAKYKREKKERELIYKNFADELFATEFILPISNSKITSYFGILRRWLYGNNIILRDIHDGVDFEAKLDEPVFATANGFIRYAKNVELLGNTIIIDHGNSICSEYYHLNTILVKEGDFVKKGEIIATAGTSGASTNVHLHWGIRINGISVDPFLFLQFNKETIFK